MNAPSEPIALRRPSVRILSAGLPAEGDDPCFLLDQRTMPADPRGIEGVVAASAGSGDIRRLLQAGAPRVYVGEAALLDSGLIEKLVAEFGAGRIGILVPARRMPVSWSMDTVSNADFRVMTPSVCEPCWEVLRADGAPTGTHAAWWMGEMFDRGVSSALVRVDIADDADLNILAGLTERWGERLWVAPLRDANPDLAAWVELGGLLQLAVPDEMVRCHPYLLAVRDASAPAPGKEVV